MLLCKLLLHFFLSFSSLASFKFFQINNEINRNQTSNVTDPTLDELYESAVESYLENDWENCAKLFEDFTSKYKKLKSAVIGCRKKCRKSLRETFEPIYAEDVEDLHSYEKKVKETLCLIRCNQEHKESNGKTSLDRLSLEAEWKVTNLEHYSFLHNCYLRLNKTQEAANAVFTYLAVNPDHEPSQASLKYYTGLPTVDEGSLRDLEAKEYVKYFNEGVRAYESKDYASTVVKFEYSLVAYLEAEEQCRFYCEGPYDQGWNPDFVIAVSNHFLYSLYCKRRCDSDMSRMNGVYFPNVLAEHFDYLQISYYKLGLVDKACEAVETFLLFAPNAETMIFNKEFYSKMPNMVESYFVPREQIANYRRRQAYENELLNYVDENFVPLQERILKFR